MWLERWECQCWLMNSWWTTVLSQSGFPTVCAGSYHLHQEASLPAWATETSAVTHTSKCKWTPNCLFEKGYINFSCSSKVMSWGSSPSMRPRPSFSPTTLASSDWGIPRNPRPAQIYSLSTCSSVCPVASSKLDLPGTTLQGNVQVASLQDVQTISVGMQ